MNYTTLISVAELSDRIDNPNLRLFDCRFNLMQAQWGHEQYSIAHLPNAQYADLNLQLASEITQDSGRHPLPDKQLFQDQMQQWGIEPDSQVVVYDDVNGAIAARLWWLCQWAGFERVALLEGGLNAWLAAGHDTVASVPNFTKTSIQLSFDDGLWLSTAQIEKRLAEASLNLVDARAKPRFDGLQEPIDPVAGHVPGAKNVPFEQNLAENGCFQSISTLKQLYSQFEDAQFIAMCGSGVTACHNLLARKHAGFGLGKLYVGSWSEWIINADRPVAVAK